MKQFIENLKQKVNVLKREIFVIHTALLDRRTTLYAKFFAAITVEYLLNPIDLIPDFIPVLGLIDDLILVPILIRITISFIPKELLKEIRAKTASSEFEKKWYFALPVLIIYLLVITWLFRYFF